MIAAIPGQPLTFADTRFKGCVCLGPERCLMVGQEDLLQAQFDGVLCDTSVELLEDTTTTDGTTWSAGSWQQIQGGLVRQSCIDTESLDGEPAPLTEIGFVSTVGTLYTVSFTIESIVGDLSVAFAGVDLGVFNSPGQYTHTVEALNTSSFSFGVADVVLAACISQASVKETNTDLTVRVIRTDTNLQVDSWTFSSKPERFHFERDHFTIDIPVGEIGAGGTGLPDRCYVVRVIDGCDEVTLESRCFNVAEHPCSLLMTACNTTDVGNIYFGDYSHQIRVKGKVVRPSWKYSVKEERLSDGNINRYYADRQSTYELRIDHLDEFGHEFMSLLPLYDHFYIEQTEYVMDAGGYSPDYNDVWDDQAPIKIPVRPKQELYRKVRCVDDNLDCSPPPNYWVEGTGPNTLYILNETDGSRIPLNQ